MALDQEVDPETGEWLECVGFRNDQGVLHVGVRDKEWLATKGVSAEWVEYESRGFKQTILEASAETTLYVSVAWRAGDRTAAKDDLSTWFAVDMALPS